MTFASFDISSTCGDIITPVDSELLDYLNSVVASAIEDGGDDSVYEMLKDMLEDSGVSGGSITVTPTLGLLSSSLDPQTKTLALCLSHQSLLSRLTRSNLAVDAVAACNAIADAAGCNLGQPNGGEHGAKPTEVSNEPIVLAQAMSLGGEVKTADNSSAGKDPVEQEDIHRINGGRSDEGATGVADSSECCRPSTASQKKKKNNNKQKKNAKAAATRGSAGAGDPSLGVVSFARTNQAVTKEAVKDSMADLEDCDDWSRAWIECKAAGKQWGGASCGGRGTLRRRGLSKDVHIEGVTLQYYGKDLLQRTKFHCLNGHRYGLIGKNGCGKTTLLRHIARGSLPGFPVHFRVLYVEQEVSGDDKTVLQTVLEASTEMDELQAEIDRLNSMEGGDDEKIALELADLYEQLEAVESRSQEGKARSILKGLQFSEKQMHQTTETLSVCWLQKHLTEYDGTVIVVSHDVAFLDAVVTDIIHFSSACLYYFPGSYTEFIGTMDDKAKKMVRLSDALDRKRQHIADSIKKLEQQGHASKDDKKLSLVASRKKKFMKMGLEKTEDGKKWVCQTHGGMRPGSMVSNTGGWKNGKMTSAPLVNPKADKPLMFSFPPAENLGTKGAIVQVKDVSFRYDETTPIILKSLDFDIVPGSRIALLGPNGCGKSTLVGLLTSQLLPTTGEVWRHKNLKVALFSQHHMNQLDLSKTPLGYLAGLFPGEDQQALRAHLGSLGVTQKLATQKLATLSGGQRSRVVFATITIKRPQLIILDEPTNHLDLEAVSALTEAIKGFNGATVTISHDRNLISNVAEEFYCIRKGKMEKLEGGVVEYVASVMQELNLGPLGFARDAMPRPLVEEPTTARFVLY